MSSAAERSVVGLSCALFAFALVVQVATALLVSRVSGFPLPALGVCFDGYLYLEIARSFPLPFAAEALDYAGQAPGYPALAALWRVLLPPGLADWGLCMLLASWIPAALAAPAFHLLGRELGVRSIWPSLLFVVANPRWVAVSATAHAESLAMLLALLTLLAYFRGRLGWCVALLALTVLTRFNALLLEAPIVLGVLVLRRQWQPRALLLLSLPLVSLGLLDLYLRIRIPAYTGIWDAHAVFWKVGFTWPFAGFFGGASARLAWDSLLPELSWASAALYLLAAGVGLRGGRDAWVLSLWVAVLVLFHSALAGPMALRSFTRLSLLAWPAALLLLWRWGGERLPRWGGAALCAGLGGLGLLFATDYAAKVVREQLERRPIVAAAARHLDSDAPRWVDFGDASRWRAPARARPPRLLLLVSVDTLRADHLGAYGGALGLSPALDALAAESLVFEVCYAPAPFTLPSVAALLTGRHPEAVGMVRNNAVLRAEIPTIGERLRAAGWATGAVVSNAVLRRESGLARGFEVYDDEYPAREAVRGAPERAADATTRAALARLDGLLGEHPAKRVFLWVHYQDPHGPYTPPPGYRERFLKIEGSAPGGERTLPLGRLNVDTGALPPYQLLDGRFDVGFYRAGYDGEVRFLDDQIAALFDGLRQRGLWDAAEVVFTADHGESLGEDDYWFAHGVYLSDALVRVPLLLRLRGVGSGRRPGPAALVDLAPTLLAHLGIPTTGLDGIDLLAPGADPDERSVALAGLKGPGAARSGLVWRGWKYLVNAPGAAEQLQRVGGDARDRAGDELGALAELRGRHRELRRRLAAGPTPEFRPLTPEVRERLRALGYLAPAER